MKKYILLSILTTVCGYYTAQAQSFESLETNSGKNLFNEGRYKFFFRNTNMSGTYTEPLSMPTVNFALRVDNSRKNGLRYSFENAFIGDGLFSLIRGQKRYKQRFVDNETGQHAGILIDRTEKTLTSGLLGWHKLALNLLSTDKFLISPGVSAGDYMISTTLRSSQLIVDAIGNHNHIGGPVQTIDPAGYYFYAGPYVIASYVINRKIWIDAHANYDFTLVKVVNPSQDYIKNPDYPLPSVLMYGADIYTTYFGLFAGVRMATLKDKGNYSNDSKRVDISVGFHF